MVYVVFFEKLRQRYIWIILYFVEEIDTSMIWWEWGRYDSSNEYTKKNKKQK